MGAGSSTTAGVQPEAGLSKPSTTAGAQTEAGSSKSSTMAEVHPEASMHLARTKVHHLLRATGSACSHAIGLPPLESRYANAHVD
jgi:hypothetical protein